MAADQLASPAELNSAMQTTVATATANIWLNAATAVVQEATGGQRLVAVVGDSVQILGTTESVLWLPQRPVTAVTSVAVDGTTLTVNVDYKLMGRSRLFRLNGRGWQVALYQPSTVAVVYSHGFASGVQDLELAKAVTLSLAQAGVSNPSGVTSEAIDDYRVAYQAVTTMMDSSPAMKAALMRAYGRRAGLVRVGGS